MPTQKAFKFTRVHPLLLFAGVLIFLFMAVKLLRFVIGLLALITPVLLIATAVINYRVIFSFGKWLATSLKTNPLYGILAIAFTIMAFPLVAVYLLIKAINSRGDASGAKKRIKGEYIPYEEVEDDFLDLSDVKNKNQDIEDRYNDLIK